MEKDRLGEETIIVLYMFLNFITTDFLFGFRQRNNGAALLMSIVIGQIKERIYVKTRESVLSIELQGISHL
ncbi:hypothetical protein Leryth_003012 [Lithospermum erythrorhizon]|nr:hypothetical protein Leryth_003012 [Lithospermum erythrorhizon]